MKKNIHPKYKSINVKCSCGNTFMIKSNIVDLNIEVCDKCHPFYTKKQKIIDSAKRIDKFNKKYL